MLFASYFVFNIEYTKKAAATMEFVQRYDITLSSISAGSSLPEHFKIILIINLLPNTVDVIPAELCIGSKVAV